MKLSNVYYAFIFLAFCLPVSVDFSIGSIYISSREFVFIGLIFITPFVVKNGDCYFSLKEQWVCVFFIFIVFASEFFKSIIFSGDIKSIVQTLRLLIPFFLVLTFIIFGIRGDVRTVYKVFLLAILCSILLVPVVLVFNIPIFIDELGNSLVFSRGRFSNLNSSFGLISLFLLYNKNKYRYITSGKLFSVVSVLSVLSLISTFNRTYIAVMLIMIIFYTFKRVSFRFSIPILSSLGFLLLYFLVDQVQYQVDKRMLSLIDGREGVIEQTVSENRDKIYDSVLEKLESGAWVIGLPSDEPIFEMDRANGLFEAKKTDISFVNVLLRFGLIPFIAYLFILYFLFRRNKRADIGNLLLFLYILVSFNADALLYHNSVFFCFFITFLILELELEKD